MKDECLKIVCLVAFCTCSGSCGAEETLLPAVPEHVPNPFKQTITTPVSIVDDLKMAEQVIYGEVNEDKSDERRLAALEHTVFGASYANARLSLSTRAAGLTNVAKHLASGRRFYNEKRWQDSKTELDEVMRLLGKEWKSLIKAEVYSRLGVCEYELSNISKSNPSDPTGKVNGALLHSAQQNLLHAQDYYKSLGQPETAQNIAKFLDTFKDKAAHYYLY